jgi:hypothetical protein
MTSDFDADFKFSTTPSADALVRRACHRLITNCCGVTRASPAEDRAGVDYWIRTPSGRVGLDLKLRREDFGAARGASIDCVIELDGQGSSGWLMKPTAAALILFACIDTNRAVMFETKKLQTVVVQNLSRWMANRSAKEFTNKTSRNGRTWANYAVIISGDLLMGTIDRLDDGFGSAANDGDEP